MNKTEKRTRLMNFFEECLGRIERRIVINDEPDNAVDLWLFTANEYIEARNSRFMKRPSFRPVKRPITVKVKAKTLPPAKKRTAIQIVKAEPTKDVPNIFDDIETSAVRK